MNESGADHAELLRDASQFGVGGGPLKSQKPNKGVIIHQADSRYEHQYRMRETSDHQPILVPEYRFSGSVFPNRNSLSEPQPALQLQPPDSPTHSILRRPPSAVLRSPLQETFPSQGDYAEDSRPPSPIAPPSPTLPRGLFTSNRHRSDSRTPIISITPSLAPPSTTSLPSQIPNTHNRESLQPPPHHVRTPTPSSSRRQSWLDRILQSPRPRSDRPSKFLRRSLTPRLYNAHEVAMSARREQDNDDYVREMQEEYEAQRRVGRLVMLLCLLFPPLLFVMAGGGMDMAVESVTKGKVKRIGSREKRIALILGTVLAIAVVVAVVVGVSVAVTTKGA